MEFSPRAQFFLTRIFYLSALFLGNSLGSEVSAILTFGRNLLILAILILGLIFLLRFYCFPFKGKYVFLLFIYISILFILSLFCYYGRIYFISQFSIVITDLFDFARLFRGEGSHFLFRPLPAHQGPPQWNSLCLPQIQERQLGHLIRL